MVYYPSVFVIIVQASVVGMWLLLHIHVCAGVETHPPMTEGCICTALRVCTFFPLSSHLLTFLSPPSLLSRSPSSIDLHYVGGGGDREGQPTPGQLKAVEKLKVTSKLHT